MKGHLCFSILWVALFAVIAAPRNAEAEGARVGGVREDRVSVGDTSLIRRPSGGLRLVSIEPTVLFARQQDSLLQVVNVKIENTADPVEAELQVGWGAPHHHLLSTALGTVQKGQAVFQVYVPDTREPPSVEFLLTAGGKIQDHRKMPWQPRRHWRVYIVPVTHHDLGYTDTIENVLAKYDSFYDDILRFCEDTEDYPEESKYRYTVEGAWSVQHFIRQTDGGFIENRTPTDVEKLAKYIKQGRIEIGALFGNEISNLCGHEELIRLMYPSFRLKRKYGAEILTASITDIPGLSWGLPTVLAGAGVKYFFAGLPTYFEWGRNEGPRFAGKHMHTFWEESAILRHGRPDAFYWQGPDGEKVLVYYQGSYGFFNRVVGPDSYQEIMDSLPGMLDALEITPPCHGGANRLTPPSLWRGPCPFDVVRYIHNGVDNYPPDVKISHIAREWNSKWAYPQLIVATNSMFFSELEKQCRDIRTFRGELPDTDYVVGAISTAKQTGINRITHDRVHCAEKFATIASLVTGYPYPAEEIRQAYDNMLLYDEHTWGKDYPAGQVQDWAWHEKSHYAYKAAGLAESILSGSLESIARKVVPSTSSGQALSEAKDLAPAGQMLRLPAQQGRHIVVFNSLSIERTDVVRVTRFDARGAFDLIDEQTGEAVPYQIGQLDSPLAPAPYAAQRYARGQFEKHELFELVFVAENVPPLGYKTYRLLPAQNPPAFPGNIRVDEGSLENRFFKVTLDPATGGVASIYDKELLREIVDQDAVDKLNQFVARWVQTGKREGPSSEKITKGQSGPVYGSLVVRSVGPGCPQLIQEIILYERIKRIDFANRVLKDSTPLLETYFAFPFKIENPQFRFEGSNSVIEPLHDQFPGSNSNYYAVQHWADVSDGQIGVTLSAIESHLLEFGGMWPCYVSQAHHGVTPPDFGRDFVKPEELTKGHVYAFVINSNFRTNFQPVQQDDMLFHYSVTTHKGGWKQARCRDFGWSAANPLIGVVVDGKSAKGGWHGHPGRDFMGWKPMPQTMSFCRVDVPNVFLLTLKRAEDGDGVIIRLIETEGQECTLTLNLPHLTVKKAWRTNLVEENEGELSYTEHSVTVPIKAFGTSTICIERPLYGPKTEDG